VIIRARRRDFQSDNQTALFALQSFKIFMADKHIRLLQNSSATKRATLNLTRSGKNAGDLVNDVKVSCGWQNTFPNHSIVA
jgi:hypothetical protein